MKDLRIPLNLQFFADEPSGEPSGNIQDVAEPENNDVDEPIDDVQEPKDEPNDEPQHDDAQQTPVQSDDDNAKFASARRKAEQELITQRQSIDAEYTRRFGQYQNPITGKPIRSEKDYFEALDAQETLQRNQKLQDAGIDPNIIDVAVANNPLVKQAQQVMNHFQYMENDRLIQNDIKEIQKLDPNIKSINDVASLPNIGEIANLVNTRNMTLTEAYKLANLDTLMNQKASATKQQVINNIKGTQHLNTTNNLSANGDSLVDIPQKDIGLWREMFDGKSDAELKKLYNKSL